MGFKININTEESKNCNLKEIFKLTKLKLINYISQDNVNIIIEDLIARNLTLLALDRFSDFLFDKVFYFIN